MRGGASVCAYRILLVRRSGYVLAQPLIDQARDLEVVFLDHHHVAVAVDAFVVAWPRIRDQPAEGSRLRVRQHDRGPDLVEQRGAGRLVAALRLLVGAHGLDLRRVEGIEDRVALAALARALARPLRVLLRL